MAHKKETPRQKMIGMMYLVLTALLALNVSRDVLNAFALVDNGLTKTTKNFSEETKLLYQDLKKKADLNSKKAGPWYNFALEVQKRADGLYDYIQSLKIRIIIKADKKTPAIDSVTVKGKNAKIKIIKPEEIATKDNTDVPAEIMIGDNNNAEGIILKQKINDFRNFVLGLPNLAKSDTGLVKSIESNLDTKDSPPTKTGETRKWETEHFEHLPLIAVTTIMSKMQNDVRNTETEVVRFLTSQVDAGDFKFNKIVAITKSNSDFILKGSEYRAEVFLAAEDSTQHPDVYVGTVREVKTSTGVLDYQIEGGGRKLTLDEQGRGIYTTIGGSPGPVAWAGLIALKNPDGTITNKPFKAQYQVGEPIAVISPIKMNVFYLGVDNPVNISVAGVPSNKIFASINNGAIKPSGKGWIVNPGRTGTATVTVTAEIDKGRKPMGSMLFRVKQLPDPVARVAGRTHGFIGKNELAVQQFVLADLGENNDFDAKFTVTEFTVSTKVRGFDHDETSHSNKITDAQRELIRSLNKGERVTFTDIKAIGPDGKAREINGIILKIQ